jgi:hypothetical protein
MRIFNTPAVGYSPYLPALWYTADTITTPPAFVYLLHNLEADYTQYPVAVWYIAITGERFFAVFLMQE